MLESLNTNAFEYEKLKPEEMQKRGILGRLVGVMADTVNPTRNGRSYSSKLWENVFQDPIMQERITHNCCFGELGHPVDREETDMEKIAIVMDGMPKKDKDGKLQAVFNILDTPNGRILKTLCDYGCNIGISSRGSGDLIQDFDGNESVDPDTYNCEGWDAVIIPAVKEARLTYVTETLDKKRYNKSLRSKLQEALDNASEDNKKIMTESLSTLGISLTEADELEPDAGPEPSDVLGDIEEKQEEENQEEPRKEESEKEESEQEEPKEEEKEEDKGFVYKGVEVLKDPNSEKFVCKIGKDDYSFNSEKNAKIWIDMTLKKSKNESLNEVQVGRDNTKEDKNVDDVLKPNGENTTTEDSSEDEEEKKDTKVTITVNESLDWESLNATEQNAFEAVIHRLENGEYKDLESFKDACFQAVELYNEANAFQDYENEDFYMEEGDPKNVFDYIMGHPVFSEYTSKLQDDSIKVEELEDEVVDNIETNIDSLQEMLIHNRNLEKQLLNLQERLSVSYAMEKSLNEKINSYKEKISTLSKAQKRAEVLAEQLEATKDSVASMKLKLTESTKSNSSKIKLLEEKLKTVVEEKDSKETELSSLKEDYELLNKDLIQTKEQFSKKFERQNQLLEKYQKVTKNAIERYINMQATNLGIKPVEIKNRLSESFTFNDIDSVCENLREYKLNVNSLPFSTNSPLNESVGIKVKNASNRTLTPRNDVDDLTDYDMKLMEAYI